MSEARDPFRRRRPPASMVVLVAALAQLVSALPADGADKKRADKAVSNVDAKPQTAPLRPMLERLLANSHRIAATRQQQQSADSNLSRARAGWWGDVTVSSGVGYERTQNPGGVADTKVPIREADVTFRQPLLDFGRIGGDVEKANLTRRQADATSRDTVQDVLLDGVTALVNVDRARKVAEYSLQAVRNIERQTGLEESRVELGGGYATDVLQAKSQLAGANARLSRARGTTMTATNHFRAVFHEPPPVTIGPVVVAYRALPKSLDDAIAVARAKSPQLEIAGLGADIAKAEVWRVRGTELAPRIDAVANAAARHNVSGTLGEKDSQTYKITVSMPFNLGMAPLHSIEAAQASARAARFQFDERRLTIDEQVANAWQNLETARETYAFYDNQIRIAAEFLELARAERQQGRRSLIDVLTGETSLFNAQADAVASQGDVAIAALTLLRTMGVLDLSAVN